MSMFTFGCLTADVCVCVLYQKFPFNFLFRFLFRFAMCCSCFVHTHTRTHVYLSVDIIYNLYTNTYTHIHTFANKHAYIECVCTQLLYECILVTLSSIAAIRHTCAISGCLSLSPTSLTSTPAACAACCPLPLAAA